MRRHTQAAVKSRKKAPESDADRFGYALTGAAWKFGWCRPPRNLTDGATAGDRPKGRSEALGT
jgi:hypothetical protein